MHEIIDVASDISEFAIPLAAAGTKTVIRYYNNRNTSQHPSKHLTRGELRGLPARRRLFAPDAWVGHFGHESQRVRPALSLLT